MKNKKITLGIGGHHIGGSSIATIMGVNPWESPLTLAMHLKGIVPRTFTQDQLNLMRMGTTLEPDIIKRTEEALGIRVYNEDLTYNAERIAVMASLAVKPCSVIVQDRDLPYLVGHLDGKFIYNNLPFVLECKYSVFQLEEIPEHYKHQCNWYMGLSNIARAKLSNLDSRGAFKIFDLEFDAELFIKQKAAAKRFWERYIVGNALPPMDGLESTTGTLNKMYQEDNGKSFTDSKYMEAWIRDLSKLQGLHKQRDSKIKLLKNKIRARMKKFACYESCLFGKVTYRKDKNDRKILRFPRGF